MLCRKVQLYPLGPGKSPGEGIKMGGGGREGGDLVRFAF